jgi:hypothetical protein
MHQLKADEKLRPKQESIRWKQIQRDHCLILELKESLMQLKELWLLGTEQITFS